MEKLFFEKDQLLYDVGQKLNCIYFIEEGYAVINFNGKEFPLCASTLGEWALAGLESCERVVVKKDTVLLRYELSEVSSRDCMSGVSFFNMLCSVTQRLNLMNSALCEISDSEQSVRIFKQNNPLYSNYYENKVFSRMLNVKSLYRMMCYEEAYNELLNMQAMDMQTDYVQEIMLWKAIILSHIDYAKASEMMKEKFVSGTEGFGREYLEYCLKREKKFIMDLYGKNYMHFPGRSIIIAEGEKCDGNCFMLLHGGLKVSRFPGKEASFFSTIDEGEVFGESSLISELPRQAMVYCEYPCDILVLSSSTVRNTIDSSCDFGIRLIKNQLHRIRKNYIISRSREMTPLGERIPSLLKFFGEKFIKAGINKAEFSSISNASLFETEKYMKGSGYFFGEDGILTHESH
jgi:CRP-like cAMP-binding protein